MDELTDNPAPVPERLAVASAVGPLLKARLPDELPADTGLNVTENDALEPDAIVTGKVIPLKPNPLPVSVSDVIVTLPPAALRVADWGWLVLPTLTLENVRLEGLIVS